MTIQDFNHLLKKIEFDLYRILENSHFIRQTNNKINRKLSKDREKLNMIFHYVYTLSFIIGLLLRFNSKLYFLIFGFLKKV
jgi:hypothetical protein